MLGDSPYGHDCDPVSVQPSGSEQQRVGRGVVEPVRIIYDAQHRALFG